MPEEFRQLREVLMFDCWAVNEAVVRILSESSHPMPDIAWSKLLRPRMSSCVLCHSVETHLDASNAARLQACGLTRFKCRDVILVAVDAAQVAAMCDVPLKHGGSFVRIASHGLEPRVAAAVSASG